MQQLLSRYIIIRSVASGSLASDDDPTAGELPPIDEWASLGAADALGTVRIVGIFADAIGNQVDGGTWSFRPVECAVIDGITSLSGVDNACAVFGAEVTSQAGGASYLITGIQGGAFTICTTGGTAPGGATQLLICARKV